MGKCIILEGPDCTGKTTLANKLADIYDIPIYHLTYYQDKEKHLNQFLDASKKIREFVSDLRIFNAKNKGFILDRYIFSEYVYNKVYRPESSLIQGYFEMANNLDYYLRHNDVELIFTLPDDKERWINFFKEQENIREEMYTSEKMDKVYDNFNILYNNMQYPSVFKYNLFKYIDK